jgi:hypothetical protein
MADEVDGPAPSFPDVPGGPPRPGVAVEALRGLVRVVGLAAMLGGMILYLPRFGMHPCRF